MAKTSGKSKGKNILLTGHTDTVPPYDFENANKPVIIGGKLFVGHKGLECIDITKLEARNDL